MRIRIVEMGNVGSALGSCWTEVGHEVIFGVLDSRDAKGRSREAKRMKAKLASVGEAAAQV
jgi:predicted dinucleotide-binding enzyme